MKIKFQRKHIGWGMTPDEPLEMVVRIYVPTDYEECHYHLRLQDLERKFMKSGYATDIGYSDGVLCISKRNRKFFKKTL
jgi:hypothetical protein